MCVTNLCRNGRWRSQWTVTFDPSATGDVVELKGVIKVQVHYYEDGNVQLVSSKDVKQNISVLVSFIIQTNFGFEVQFVAFCKCNELKHPLNFQNETEFASEFVKLVETAETEYHNALSKYFIYFLNTNLLI